MKSLCKKESSETTTLLSGSPLSSAPEALSPEDLRTYYTENPFPSKEYNEEHPFPSGDANPLPTFGDVVRAVTDICILPMGSETVHSLSPHVRSVLICTPKGSGKRSLVNAICTELNATLIDLTCTNIASNIRLYFHYYCSKSL